MFYVVANARSGTQTIANVLNCAENSAVYHEAEAYPWLELEKDGYSGKLCIDEVRQFIPPKFVKSAVRDGKIPGDSNHYISPHISAIARVYPDTKFIYLLRDPADIIRSWMNLVYPMNDDYLDLIYEHHRWRPFRRNVKSRFVRLCMYWKHTNQRILTSLSDTDYVIVKIEELESHLCTIWQWLGFNGGYDKALLACKRKMNTRAPALHPPFPEYNKWNNAQKEDFREIVQSSPAYFYNNSNS